MKVNDLVFVYGTLRKGGYWHTQGILGVNPPMIMGGTINGTLYNLWGRVPTVSLSGDYKVVGEIYRLPSEEVINRLERLEYGYQCSQVEVETPEGSTQAWVFHREEDLDGLPVVESADWMAYMRDNPEARF